MRQLRPGIIAGGSALAFLALFAAVSGCAQFKALFARQQAAPDTVGASAGRLPAIRPAGGSASAHYRLARFYVERGRHHEAMKEFKKAIEAEPTHAKAWNGLGVSLDALGRYEDASQAYTEALRLDPSLDYVHNNLGSSLAQRGDHGAAAAAFQKAVELNPGNAVAHGNLARLSVPTTAGAPVVVPAPGTQVPLPALEQEPPSGGVAVIPPQTPEMTSPFAAVPAVAPVLPPAPVPVAATAPTNAEPVTPPPSVVAQVKVPQPAQVAASPVKPAAPALSPAPAVAEVKATLPSQVSVAPAKTAPPVPAAAKPAPAAPPVPDIFEVKATQPAQVSTAPAKAAAPVPAAAKPAAAAPPAHAVAEVKATQPAQVSTAPGKAAPPFAAAAKPAPAAPLAQAVAEVKAAPAASAAPVRTAAAPAEAPKSKQIASTAVPPLTGIVVSGAPDPSNPETVRVRIVSAETLRKENPVELANESGSPTLLGAVTAGLAAKGYRVEGAKESPETKRAKTMILYREGALQPAYQVAQAFPGYQEMKRTETFDKVDSNVRVLLGRDMEAHLKSFGATSALR